ncbi:MAG TPA: peptidase M4 [Methanosarcina sp.]|nr:peptidase M4 [Methanosarcina sp.]
MANNKNLIIGLLLIVVVILLAFLVLRPMMYGSTYGPNAYASWRMGPGMGPGMMYNPGGNYSYGPGMMGGMAGNMMALYYPDAKPITQDVALKNMENFVRQYGSNTEVEDFMAFSSNYYAVVKDTGSGQDIAEVLVDRYSGAAYPEPGPNMMWNTRYGSGRVQTGSSGYDLAGAKKLAENFLTGYLPGAQIQEAHEMPGYYTFDFGRNETESMLSVNAYSGQIWVHTWHGPVLGGMNVTS